MISSFIRIPQRALRERPLCGSDHWPRSCSWYGCYPGWPRDYSLYGSDIIDHDPGHISSEPSCPIEDTQVRASHHRLTAKDTPCVCHGGGGFGAANQTETARPSPSR